MNREPSMDLEDPKALLLGQLEHYRAAAVDKLDGLSADQLRSPILPSGWSPLEMLNHLVHMERRWVHWGFAARSLSDPRGDRDADGRFRIADAAREVELTQWRVTLVDLGRQTAQICADQDLQARSRPGGHFTDDDPRPTLGWILLHVLQEYARHVGQLDVVRELLDGGVGE